MCSHNKLEKYKIVEQLFEKGGSDLPLSVWEIQGFNPDDIEAKSTPDNIQIHPMLGKCYRVVITSKGVRGGEGHRQTQCLTDKPSCRKITADQKYRP